MASDRARPGPRGRVAPGVPVSGAACSTGAFTANSPPPEVRTSVLMRSLLHFAAVWVAYGAACGCLARAVGTSPFGLYAAAFPLAYLLGYAAIFAPGGLGVREGALVWLCGGDVWPWRCLSCNDCC